MLHWVGLWVILNLKFSCHGFLSPYAWRLIFPSLLRVLACQESNSYKYDASAYCASYYRRPHLAQGYLNAKTCLTWSDSSPLMLALSQSRSSCVIDPCTHICLHKTHVLLYLCVLGSHIKALAAKVVHIPTATWLLYLRHLIEVPTVLVSLCPWVAPHRDVEPLHVHGSLHVVTLACSCVAIAHVRQQLALHSEASIPHITSCIAHRLLMRPRCYPHETTVTTCSVWGAKISPLSVWCFFLFYINFYDFFL